MKTFILALMLLLPSLALADVLKIESHPVLNSILKEMQQPGSSGEIYPVAEQYRLDLTLTDLIDQTALVFEDRPELNDRLNQILNKNKSFPNFLGWFKELQHMASEDQGLKKKLDRKLYLQFYSPSGVALIPDYKFLDIRKIKDNFKLQRIKKYNQYAADPEGPGLLAAFAKKEWKGFYTKPLTITKLKEVHYRDLKKIHKAYYDQLIKLYVDHDPTVTYKKTLLGSGIKAAGKHLSKEAKKLFKVIQQLPTKHQVLFSLAQKVPGVPSDSGFFILTASFIQQNLNQIEEALQDMTLDQILHSSDDRYLLAVRKYIKDNEDRIGQDLLVYNKKNKTEHKLIWKNRNKKPGRIEAMANIDVLLLLYPDSPWFKGEHGTIIDRNGKQIFLNEKLRTKIGRFFKKIGTELIQSENYLSFLAGAVTFAIADGNIPVALATRNVVKSAIETAKYDHEWTEFLKELPNEVINAMLLTSGLAPGRFFKIVALGAGGGFIQGLLTGQDLRTSALVGASLNIIQYYILPTSWARPMVKGYDAKALAMNRKLELLEGSIKGLIQGATVAAIEGDNIIYGAMKGSAFGFVSTQMIIWFVGTRYNPFKGWSDDEIDEMIKMENDFQNRVGRGGVYEIDRQLIMDANYRTGGVLADWASASITLPGNVTMSQQGFNRLSTMTHEAHHLMQQHQSGVFGFYLFRYIPAYLQTGYGGHPDENFLFGLYNT